VRDSFVVHSIEASVEAFESALPAAVAV